MATDTLTFEGVLNAAFNQIRQFSSGSPSVVIRLIEAFSTIYHFTKKSSQRKAVHKHAKMVLAMAKKTFAEDNDLKDLEERAKEILAD